MSSLYIDMANMLHHVIFWKMRFHGGLDLTEL